MEAKTLAYIIALQLATGFATATMAQNAARNEVKGTIVDGDGKAVEGAAVAWLSLPDSTLIGGTVVGNDGSFAITSSKAASATASTSASRSLLAITCVGYEKTMLDVPADGSEMKVVMKSTTHKLKEVTVKSKSKMESKPGGFVFTPRGADLLLLNAYEVMRFAPMVDISRTGVSILGAGSSQIYINGRKPNMSHELVVQMLQSAKPKDIVRIEIMQNPGSKYKASTSGGIVNIVMKRPNYGAMGSATAVANFENYRISPSATAYMGYAYGKFRASAGLGIGYQTWRNTSESLYKYKNTGTEIYNKAENVQKTKKAQLSLNASYDLTPKSVLGASASLGLLDQTGTSLVTTTKTAKGASPKLSRTVGGGAVPLKRPDFSSTIYYTLATDKRGSSLDISASYTKAYSPSRDTTAYENASLQDGLYRPYDTFTQNITADNYAYEAKARYTHNFKDNSTLDAGAEMTHSTIDNDFTRTDLINGTFTPNTTLSNRFVYKENIFAAFAEYSRNWCKTFSSRIGLRAEMTRIDGDLKTTGERFENNYGNIVPNVSLNFKLFKRKHSLNIDYSPYLSRPYYSQLSPFKIWTSENTYATGNPKEKSWMCHSLGFTYRTPFGLTVGSSFVRQPHAKGNYVVTNNDDTSTSGIAEYGNSTSIWPYIQYSASALDGRLRFRADANGYYDKSSGKIQTTDVGFENFDYKFSGDCTAFLGKQRQLMLSLKYQWQSGFTAVTRHKEASSNITLASMMDFGKAGYLTFYAMLPLSNEKTYFDSPDFYYHTRNWRTFSTAYISLEYSITFGKYEVRGAANKNRTSYSNRKSAK